jgi:hypothetical protein
MNHMGAIKQINTTPEYLIAKGLRKVANSRKFDGGCVLPSTLWATDSGTCYHLITYCAPDPCRIFARLFSSTKRWTPRRRTATSEPRP